MKQSKIFARYGNSGTVIGKSGNCYHTDQNHDFTDIVEIDRHIRTKATLLTSIYDCVDSKLGNYGIAIYNYPYS
jgi:hypothetical protein